MSRKTVVKASIFSASAKTVFDKLKELRTLQYIAAPLATFRPVNGSDDLVWEEGGVFSFHFKVFGLIPLGIHTIRVLDFNEETHCIYTHEGNAHVPVWNHRITLKSIHDHAVEYTDEVEINAGWKTPFVYLWAKAFYSHRQRKWKKLLRKQDRASAGV